MNRDTLPISAFASGSAERGKPGERRGKADAPLGKRRVFLSPPMGLQGSLAARAPLAPSSSQRSLLPLFFSLPPLFLFFFSFSFSRSDSIDYLKSLAAGWSGRVKEAKSGKRAWQGLLDG